MAEIKIEKKKAIWPWILLLLLIAAILLYFFVFRKDGNEIVATTPTADTTTQLIDVRENNATVADYVAYARDTSNKMALDHDFSSTALTKLADATEAMAGAANYDIKMDIDKARSYADYITKNPAVIDHADSIKAAAKVMSNTLQNLEQAKYPSLAAEAADVQVAANQIDPTTLTLDQKSTVRNFFLKAADLLEKMN